MGVYDGSKVVGDTDGSDVNVSAGYRVGSEVGAIEGSVVKSANIWLSFNK